MLILFATLVMAISLNSENTANGLIEIKKYKAINSPKVCGEKLCNEVDTKRSEKGLSTRDIKVCDDRLCNEISETKMTSPVKQEKNVMSDARLSITPEIINGKKYLTFEGFGWHRSHNVEITITNDDEKIASIRSLTNDNGILHMPWPLPSNLSSGLYQIHATDGIHQNKLTIPISGEIPVEIRTISSELEVVASGETQVRRGTTHTIEVHVNRDNNPIEGARVNITIEDYGEDIIREFSGYTNQEGYFEFSWEIPQRFDDIETLLAFVDVTDGISSKTELFKFQVYCLPGENNCEVEGN